MIGATFCSGIGAPEASAPGIDWRFASEIEPFPRAVLESRFGYRAPEDHNQGDPLLWGDMTTVTPDLWRQHGIPLPELIVAGTPCQAFSIAGARKGLGDDRGNLTLKFVEIVHDIVSARHDEQLTVLWENVPGVLSDKSNAFGCFLAALVGAQHPLIINGSWPSAGMVSGPRARAAWIVRDAQYFGVPQRRRRVFVVIDFGNRVDPAKILFEPKGMSGNNPPRRKEGQDIAGTLGGSSQSGGFRTTDLDNNGAFIVEGHHGEIAGTVSSKWSKGSGGPAGDETQNMVAFSDSVAFAENQRGEVRTSDTVPALSIGGGKPGQGYPAIAIQERAISENPNAGPDGAGVRDDDTAFTLEARTTAQAVVFKPSHYTRGKDGSPREIVPALSADADKGDQDAVVAYDLRGREGGAMPEGPHDTANIRAASGGSSNSYIAGPVVRRLMPSECAALQGFKRDHCAITYRGKPAADGPQYKAYGNSMAVPVVKWIIDRILAEAGR